MKAHRHLVAALGMIVFVLIVMMPGVTLTMPSLGAPLLEGTITPTAYVYLPYVAKDYFPSPTPSPTPTVTSTSTATSTATSSPTPSTTPTSTSTNTPTATRTATSSPTPSATPTRTATKTPTATDTGATSVPLATPLQSPTPEPPASPTATTGARLPVVNVPATIAANTTWTAGNVYLVTGQTTVNAGVTLSVEPGAIIKFQDSGSVNGKLIVNGILSAQGTAANRIIFTSVHDDSWGGDTNQNGGATWPTAGDWDGISLGNASGGSILDYTVVTYGGDVGNVLVNGASVTVRRSFVGYGAASGLRWMNGASGQIADNRIEQNLLYGIYLSAASSPVISGNSLAHNRFYAIYLEGNCTPTFSGNTAYGNGLNGVGVFGTVASGAWYPGLPYIATQNLVVEPGSTLTLQPGTVVKFLPNTSFVVRGALAASGTISNPVVFTSINDDSFGGDTHQNGNAVKPNPGDWGTLYFADTSDDLASALDRVVIRYGGAGYNYGAGTSYADLSLDSASPRIANSTFERSSRYGAQFINVSSPQFQGNLVLDNTDHGLWISPSSAPAVLDNSFVRNGGYAVYVTGSSQAAFGGSTAAGNRVNGIGMTGSLNADTTWEYDLPYVVDGSLTLDLSTNLTVQPGIVVKVTINGLFTINGNLSARGTAENRIVFTSLKDDSIAGDTNGDGIATAPVPGDWAGIRFASTASGSDLDFVTVRYAGRNASTGAVFLDGGAPNLGHLVVMGSQYRGLYVQNASPVVENAVFSENATGIYNGPTAYLTVNNSDIYSNTQYGLYNANSAYTVNATNSWWGAATGPTHSSNPGGTGDRVSDGVNYSPYLGAPPVALPPALPGFPAPPTYTQVSGLLTSNTTWTLAQSPYLVVGDVTVNAGVRLTIEPGVVVKFVLGRNLTINGILVAEGTADSRIIFTSIKDDSVGGDANGDGSATWPRPGDWGRIAFGDSSVDSQTRLRYAVVRYGGSGGAGVYVDSASPTIADNLVSQNAGYGLHLRNQSAAPVQRNWILDNTAGGIRLELNSTGSIANNRLWGNTGYAVYMDTSCYPTFSSNEAQYNEVNGVRVSGSVTFNQTWYADLPYVIEGGVTINTGPALTLQPGTIVKFRDTGSSLTVNGALIADGTQTAPIIFTSLRDDAYGGDTDNDDGIYWPEPGDWYRIYFADPSDDGRNILRHVNVRYGGAQSVYVNSAAPRIISNTIAYAGGHGLYLTNQSNSLVQSNTFLQNGQSGLHLTGSSAPTIRDNVFRRNRENAVEMTAESKPRFSGNQAIDNTYNGVKVSGAVAGATTWDDDLTYVAGAVTIPSDASLTLSPGTVVKFLAGANWTINGTLIADGTVAAPIVLTSPKDDAHGGDTNNDSNASVAGPGDWGTIAFASTSANSRITNAFIRYGGNPAIRIDQTAMVLTADVFTRNYGAIDLRTANQISQPLINNTFENNQGYSIWTNLANLYAITPSNTFVNTVGNAVRIDSATLTNNLTLYSGVVYWPSSLTVPQTYTLSIQPGAVVKLGGGGSPCWADLEVLGSLVPQGTVTNPVYITSLRDDSVGGDTNGDGNATSPTPGDWRAIELGNNATATFDYTVVRYGGASSSGGSSCGSSSIVDAPENAVVTLRDSEVSFSASDGIEMNATRAYTTVTATLTVERSTIAYNGQYGVAMGYSLEDRNNTLTVSNSFIRNNGSGGIVVAEMVDNLQIIGNSFTNNGYYPLSISLSEVDLSRIHSNSGTGNTQNAIGVWSSTLTGTSVMNAELPYAIAEVFVLEGAQLQIQPGAVVKLGAGSNPCRADLEVLGSLVSQGTATNPVYITSLRDDSVGGDTNGDGNATSPTPGDWRAIELGNNATATFDYTVVRYGGASSSGGSSCGSSSIVDAPENAVVTLRDSEVSFSASNGIEMNTWNSSMPYTPTLTVERSVLADNVADGISMLAYSNGANVLSIFGSIIRDNGQSGIDIDRPLNATVRNSMIYGNAGFGALAGWIDVNSRLDARYNYWGSEDGPAPYGSGDAINTFTQWDPVCQCNVTRPAVIFSPWLNSAGQVVAPPPAQSHAAPSSPATSWAAEPVNVVFGNYTYQYTDLAFPTRGLDFGFQRTYNSAMTDTGPLGPGWTHSYNITATQTASNTVVVQREDGRKDLYTFAGGGVYLPPPGIHDVLVWATDHFVITTTNQVVYTFNPGGLLAGITDRNGNTTSLTYSGGKLSAVTDPTGRQVTFTYTGNLLTQITDPSGRSVSFGYTSGRLTTVTDVTGRTTTYAYDGNGRLQSITDANGHTFVYNVYDGQGRVVQQRDALNNLTTFNYDTTNRRTTVTDPRGNATVYAYDATYRVTGETDALGNTESYVYDADSNRISATDKRGNTSAYTHDGQGNVLTATDPLGGVTTFTYDTRNNLASERDPRNSTTTYTYDTRSNPTQRRDALNNLTTWSYDAFGQVLSTTDARSNTTRFGYDSYGHQTVITDALGITTTFTYDLVGRKLSERNPLGFVTGYGYDAANRLRVVTDALGFTTVYTYDLVGNRIAVQDALGRVTRYGYDAKDRLAVITDTLGNMTRYTYDANNNQTGLTNALGRTTIYTYDALNRRASATDPLGNVTSYLYDANGNRTRLTDANGRITQYAYDALNRLTSVTDAAGGTVTYAYDAAGNRTGMTDANSHTTTYAYDALNRLLSTSDPLSNTTAYGYDAVGNRTRATQPTGTVITYTYDALNRLSGITSTGLNIAYAYDAVGNRRTMTDTVGVTTYTYDVLNRLTQAAAPNGTLGYGYDANGNRIRLTYPGGQIVTSTYDLANRLTTVTDWAGRVTSYTYDAANRQTGIQYPNSTQATYVYDNADRLLSIRHTSTVSGTLAVFTYTLDAVGNRLSMQDLDGLTSYGYDSLYRLTSVTYPNAEQVVYAYDPMGNRTGMTSTVSGVTTYSYDAADRLLRAGADTFGWDANGRQITRTFGANTATYTFDPLDRLTQVVSGTVTVQFGYDGDGVRTSKTVGSVATQYVQDVSAALPVVVAETTAGQTNRYVYGNDLLEQVSPAGSPAFYHADGLGSTRALSNLSGQRTDAYSYDVFGQVRSRIGSAAQPFAFAGEQTDGELGLVYLRARYYDPQVGRFVTQDTFPGHAREPQTINKYVYASDNPVLVTDPTGLFNLKQFGIGAFDMLRGAGTVATSVVLGSFATGLCATGVGCIAGAPIGAYAANQAFVGGQMIGYGAVELGMGIGKSSTAQVESFEAYDPLRELTGRAGAEIAPHLGLTVEQGRGFGEASKDVLDIAASLLVSKIPGSKADTVAYALWQQGAMSTISRSRLLTSLLVNPLTKTAGDVSRVLKILKLTSSTVYAPDQSMYYHNGGYGWGDPPSGGK